MVVHPIKSKHQYRNIILENTNHHIGLQPSSYLIFVRNQSWWSEHKTIQ